MERFIIEEAEPDSNGMWEIRTMNLYHHYQAKIRQVDKVLVIVVARGGGKEEEHIHDRKSPVPIPNGA